MVKRSANNWAKAKAAARVQREAIALSEAMRFADREALTQEQERARARAPYLDWSGERAKRRAAAEARSTAEAEAWLAKRRR